MAELTPVVVCLSRSGEATARRVADALGAAVHGREGRVEDADALFADALEHIRTLFALRGFSCQERNATKRKEQLADDR